MVNVVFKMNAEEIKITFFFGSILIVGVLTQLRRNKKCTKSYILLYLSYRDKSIERRCVQLKFYKMYVRSGGLTPMKISSIFQLLPLE